MKVSTIIPVYNGERTIAQAIDSALAQECDGHEVVVVDDGSTDSTAAILSCYGNRIRVIAQRNGGAAASRNLGVRRSTGQYIALLDADDVWMPGKLNKMVAALDRNPHASLAFSDFTFIEIDGTLRPVACCDVSLLDRLANEPFLIFSVNTLTSTWLIPRTMYQRTGGYCEAFKGPGGYEDHWMLLLLRELGEFVYVRESLIFYRDPQSGKTADKYGPALPVFISQVKKHSSARRKALIRCAKNKQCQLLLSKVAHQMNCRDRVGAVASLMRIATLRPAYFLSQQFSDHLALPQNMKRLRDLTLGIVHPNRD